MLVETKNFFYALYMDTEESYNVYTWTLKRAIMYIHGH